MCRYSVLLLVAAQLAIFISAFPQNEASLPDGSKKFLTGKDYEHGDHVPDDEMTREESIDKVEKERNEIIEANLKDPNIIEGDIIVPPNANGSIHRRSVYSDERMLWPNGRVPYEIRSSYNSKQRAEIAAAFQSFERHTCIRFVPRKPSDRDFVYIQKAAGCSSYVGKIGGPQVLKLGDGCMLKGIIMHELLHAIGFVHEQSRPDRDQFVQILFENVRPGLENNFEMSPDSNTAGTPYDFGSVMHYSMRDFSVNGKPTIVSKPPGIRFGQRKGFSKWDLYEIVNLYKCKNKVPDRCENTRGCEGTRFVDPEMCPEDIKVCD